MSDSIDPLDETPRARGKEQAANVSDNQLDSSSGLPKADMLAEPVEEKPPQQDEKPQPWGGLWLERRKLVVMFSKVYLTIFIMWLGVLSLYWGSVYRREDRVRNMKMLVVLDDAAYSLGNSTEMEPPIAQHFRLLLESYPEVGDFEYANTTKLHLEALANNRTVYEEIQNRVYSQQYWTGFYINSTASELVYDMLAKNLTTAAAQIPYLVNVVYESGRHYSALAQYVMKSIRKLQLAWASTYAPAVYADTIRYALTADERTELVVTSNSTSSAAPLSYLPVFNLLDLHPSQSTVVLGPSELGLIYAMIFTFHQFNFSTSLHDSIKERLRFRHYLWYRILFSQFNYVVLALVYALMTLAFQVPTGVAFGRSGFLVLWATMYLFMGACGGLNECAGTLVNYLGQKQLIAPWIIFTIVINIAPTFAPVVLSPGFYKYGYATPMLNVYEALRVVFFNTWKGTLGRNYGVLVAWVVVSNVLLCVILLYMSRKANRILAEKQKAANTESEKKADSSPK